MTSPVGSTRRCWKPRALWSRSVSRLDSRRSRCRSTVTASCGTSVMSKLPSISRCSKHSRTPRSTPRRPVPPLSWALATVRSCSRFAMTATGSMPPPSPVAQGSRGSPTGSTPSVERCRSTRLPAAERASPARSRSSSWRASERTLNSTGCRPRRLRVRPCRTRTSGGTGRLRRRVPAGRSCPIRGST